ncbi:uncharacterized protein LOC133845532 [Drosophila sulfurigaster albostrigata]|uniref:uncharacterized protein LOC133845532 n=1 Tax=Drosophila sulfurigaster albostrigata TaxID=89887 RepID=UPI002D21C925|nr:uncharacterized protein LOC133845532 [Drosophila sulfurigaster albostrigata]
MPCLEICIPYASILIELPIRFAYFVFVIVFYTSLYVFRTWRRSAPFNYLVYVLTSISTPISTSLYLIHIDQSRWLHAYPLMIIIELIVLVFYTTQQRIKFSHAIGILVILLVYGLIVLLFYFLYVNGFFRMLSFYGVTFEAWYIIYDTHLMLCGVHGYNLQPDEHMYAAGNIHADLPKFLWIIIGHFVLGPVRGFIKALRHSRTNYIC